MKAAWKKATRAERILMLAREFDRGLRVYLSAAHYAEMIHLNANEEDRNVCHSHDHCDANVFMGDAFVAVRGSESRPWAQPDADLWNAAWDCAKLAWNPHQNRRENP